MDDMDLRERLIVALDFPGRDPALELVDTLSDAVSFYKVGYELFIAEGLPFVRELRERGKKVFLDLKLDDVDETIRRAVRRISAEDGIELLTIHGGKATAEAAVEGRGGGSLKVLQVTLLTSMGEDDLRELMLVGPDCRFKSIDEYLVWRADTALAAACDGLISSGQNAALLREHCGDEFTLVCPGIRPSGQATQEHKRPMTPYQAILDGADYLVVGRPIRDAAAPAAAADAVVEEIERGFADRA